MARTGIRMPDLAGMLMRSSIGALAPPRELLPRLPAHAAGRRAVHELGSGRRSASSASARCPDERRQAVRSERVHASERRLAVVPRAA